MTIQDFSSDLHFLSDRRLPSSSTGLLSGDGGKIVFENFLRAHVITSPKVHVHVYVEYDVLNTLEAKYVQRNT